MSWLLLALVGCGSPISNRLFSEDASFLAALPTADELAVPSDIQNARVGTEPVLAQAITELAILDEWTSFCGAVTQALSAVEPDERSIDRRAWHEIEVIYVFDGEPQSVRAAVDIVRIADRIDWAVGVGDDLLWEGSNEGTVEMTVHLANIPGSIWPGELTIAQTPIVEDTGAIDTTSLPPKAPMDLVYRQGVEVKTWWLAAPNLMSLAGELPLDEPTLGTVLISVADGGRATGAAADGRSLDLCWNDDGDRVFLAVDEQAIVGEESSCTLAQPVPTVSD